MELWKQTVENNTIQLTHNQLKEILIAKMESSKVLAQDIAYWRRLPEGNDQRTYEYLVNAMQSHLDRTQMTKNQETRRAIIQRGILGGQVLGVDGKQTPPASGRRAGRQGGGNNGGEKKPCYFFNHGGCKFNEDKCSFKHVIVPEAEKAQMEPPVRRTSGSPPPNRTQAQEQPRQQKLYCQFHLKGKCTKGDDCVFLHVEKEEVERQKARAKAAAKAKAKAKAEPKAKAKAKAMPARMCGHARCC